MTYEYFGGLQRSPEWFELRRGRVTASRLADWLSVSKAEKTKGAPLKARLDYEKELQFEKQFGTSFEKYVTPAMQEGIDFEGFAREQYVKIKGNVIVEECGAWYNDLFVASPDGLVFPKGSNTGDMDNAEGLLEIKVLKDTSFTEVLSSGVPDKHMKQIQGQLAASGREWCDYVAVNLNTRKVAIIRVERDQDEIDWIELTLTEKLVVGELNTSDVFDFVDEPSAELVQAAEKQNNLGDGWA